MFVIVVVTTGLGVWTVRSVGAGLNGLIERVRDIAQGEGDLTKRVDLTTKDELGELAGWFNQFLQIVHDLMASVSGVSIDVASAASQMAASSEQIAAGMSEQSQQVQSVSAAVHQMSASVMEVVHKSSDAASDAGEAGDVAAEGGRVVSQTVDGMTAIREAVAKGAQSVKRLGQRGEQIGKITEVINDIADQTNLLALNAAIEAARAGEHGRGFAVVADQVRKLADRTTKATDEIAQSIAAIQDETNKAVGLMNAGTDRVTRGVETARSAGQSLEQIVSKAQQVAVMVRSIAAVAEEQGKASDQVSKNVETIRSVTVRTTEGSAQMACSASELARKAEQLRTMVGKFKFDETDRAAA